MLADSCDFVIGVDTHARSHAYCLIEARGGLVLAHVSVPASTSGYRRAFVQVCAQAPGRRVWALEGTGSYGKGLARFLHSRGERLVEVERPLRQGRRGRSKSDPLDAERAARAVLQGAHAGPPRQGALPDELQVLLATREGAVKACSAARNELHALLVGAPAALRERLQPLGREELVTRCSRLRGEDAWALALRLLARRIRFLQASADALEGELELRVQAHAPELLTLYGVGPVSGAALLCAWSHAGRVRSEAAFARLAGAAPLEASSGAVVRHRLDRGGDRRLNRGLHTIVLCRRRGDPATRAYIARRVAEGKSQREAVRCLKRYLARSLFRQLEGMPISA